MAWLLGEEAGPTAGAVLGSEALIVASRLTLLEADRAVRSAQTRGRLSAGEGSVVRQRLDSASGAWNLVELDREILGAAQRDYPIEPVRALDAIHLAAALDARVRIPDLKVLSLDERVRRNAEALGFTVVP